MPHYYVLSSEIARARTMYQPIVALESTVITHGLPYPDNIRLAQDMEAQVRGLGAIPATIAVVDGRICVGLNKNELEKLGQGSEVLKISARDIAPAVACGASGGTTVAATMTIAHTVGIQVFATGGIGGVHRQPPGSNKPVEDVSADLEQLARVPIVVVCAGVKAILDIPATLERLETLSVPVVGYETEDFPAFYSRRSGYPTGARADRPEDVAKIAQTHWALGMRSAVLVAVPPPEDTALAHENVDGAIEQALQEAFDREVRGQEVTPFLLKRVSELTGGDSLRANLGLLLNNARVASMIARYIAQYYRL
ncbi:MAG: pseudouridine-5'-phosphate glycosidase [Omnitrophica WOR_2 bacterium]